MRVSQVMKVLVACEYSGIVTRAFLEKGHDAWSCDLLPTEDLGLSNRHIQDDVRNILSDGWDLLMVAHPPCTRLCNSGVKWLHKAPPGRTLDEMWRELEEGCALFSELLNASHIPMRCLENPVMHKHAKQRIKNYRKYSQTIQPWQYGHGETKATCLWNIELPNLVPTNIVEGREARIHKMGKKKGFDRGKERSKTYPGIAKAMAEQWG